MRTSTLALTGLFPISVKRHQGVGEARAARIGNYFLALASGDCGAIETVLHDGWEMKTLDSGGIASHDRRGLLIGRIKHAGPADHSQLASVDVVQESMAVVRIDLPAREETRFMAMLRVGAAWRFVLERRSRNEV